MRFDDLLSRADDQVLQQILGPAAVRLVLLLNWDSATTSRLREIALNLYTPVGLLLAPNIRKLLFELLRPAEAEQLVAALKPGANGDPFAVLDGLSIPRRSDREAILFAFFELVPPEAESTDAMPVVVEQRCGYPLFHHQRDAARSITRLLSQEPHRALLHMPTGAGKTRTAMHIVLDHLRQREPTVVVWLANSEELCEQAAAEFGRAWTYLGDRPVPVYRFWGDRAFDPATISDGVVVAGLAKTYQALKRSIGFINALASKCSLVVIDEAHQAIAETVQANSSALVVQQPRSALLGLTATPGRTWSDIQADQELASFFARRKVTLAIQGYENPVEYLVDNGYLAQVTYRSLLYRSGLALSEQDLQTIACGLEIPDAVLRRLAEDEQRNLQVLYEIEDLAKRHSRILVFAITVRHSELLASVLRARGLDAASVTSNTPSTVRSAIIEKFKSDTQEPQILCNYGVLTTGFDAPRTSAAVIARPTNSLVLYSQMVGRAIRGAKAGGNAAAEIVTVVDQEIPGFGTVAEAFKNWEDVWE